MALARQATALGSRSVARKGRLFGSLRLVAERECLAFAPARRWTSWNEHRASCWRPYSSALGDGKDLETEGEKAEAAATAADDEDDEEEEEEDEDSDLDKVTVTDEEEEEDDDEEDDSKIYSRNTRQLLPREVVAELDRFIVGQNDAKRAVAIALRNRWRRKQLAPEVKEEIMPKNILMIGPTGVGKTEIARRLAKLAQAPFLKVEATKFTEVGFHGRDVDQIIRDLLDVGINETKALIHERNKKKFQREAENKMLDLLTGENAASSTRDSFRRMLRNGLLDHREVEIEVMATRGVEKGNEPQQFETMIRVIRDSLQMRAGGKSAKMTVKEALPVLVKQEGEKLINMDLVIKEAIEAVEQDGIVFIDEIDKICQSSQAARHADASAEGVQRDLLPLIEGSTVSTKHGNIDTSKILFIASGAFYSCKPSDLLAELQGRLPIRVELTALTENDMYKILTEPEMNLIKQQKELLKTEEIDLQFSDAAVKTIAKTAAEVNHTVENIGARRLHTVIEKILEDASFNCDQLKGTLEISETDVEEKLKPLLEKTDLSKFVL